MQTINWDLFNYIASLLLTAITTLGLGLFVLLKNRALSLNRVFFLMSSCIAIWSFNQSFIHTNYTISIIAGRIEHGAIALIAASFLHFSTILTNRPQVRLLKAVYVIAGAFSMLGLFSDTIVGRLAQYRISPTLTIPYAVRPGLLYNYYFFFFTAAVVYGIILLYQGYRSSHGSRRNQLKYMLVGAVIGFIGGGTNFYYVYDIPIYPITPFATYAVPVYVIIATYAIVKHRLMDIKVVLGRTGLLVLIYGLVIYATFQSVALFKPYLEERFGMRWVFVPGLMYTVLVTLAPFLYLYMQRKFEDKFYAKQKQYQKTLKQLSSGMTRIKDLGRLLDLTVIQIVRSVRVTHATIFLYNRSTNSYILKASRGGKRISASVLIPADSSLIRWLSQTKAPVIVDELAKNYPDDRSKELSSINQIRSEIKNLNAAVCIGGFIQDKMIGFLILGEKLSSQIYTPDDLDTFATLTNQTVLAIDNAQAYEDLKDTRDQLVQSERLATIGRFSSEVAHEIKNPLQTIKTFAELINERHDDKEFREKFSKLTQEEVNRIDSFVRQLIKVAHPLSPHFESVDIIEVLNSVVELMENDFKNKQINVIKNYETSAITVSADREQMKQVFINLIVNSAEAMENAAIKELTLEVKADEEDAVVSITDTGCGISADALTHIFNPLFTTKKKGSGLGLSIVDTIIKNHKGAIKAESASGKGATFIITLPIEHK